MDQVSFQHKNLANGRWAQMSFPEQMGNVGSEISRAIRWKANGNTELMKKCVYRALELLDLTIAACGNDRSKLRELCRAREEVCDFFLADNDFHSSAEQIMRYYDAFAIEAQLRKHAEAENPIKKPEQE